jgi:hypothetical protein
MPKGPGLESLLRAEHMDVPGEGDPGRGPHAPMSGAKYSPYIVIVILDYQSHAYASQMGQSCFIYSHFKTSLVKFYVIKTGY